MKCPYCGAESSESKCTFCGADIPGFTAEATPAADSQPVYGDPAYAAPVSQTVAPVSVTGLWVLAIIATVCSLLFGILSIINVNGVNKATSIEEQQKKIKNAKIFAFIGIGLNVVIIIARIVAGV